MTTLREVPAPPLESWPPQACAGADPRLFFPQPGKGGRARLAEAYAKSLCRSCEALTECKAYAMPIFDLYGIWGAMNQNERTRARKKQKEAD